ncbi:MAG: hypothetical protein RIE32_12725 [Phycisphaerales bacterium]
MRWGRAIRTLLVFVLLGAVTTVLSSWAIHAVQRWRTNQSQSHAAWHIPAHREYPRAAGPRVDLTAPTWAGLRRTPDGFAWARAPHAQFQYRSDWSAPGWRAHVEGITVPGPGNGATGRSQERMAWFESGWPRLAMAHGSYTGYFYDGPTNRVETRTGPVSLRGGLLVMPWRAGPINRPLQLYPRYDCFERTTLAVLPIWPGFLLNTLLYALLLFVPARIPRAVRRALRRRRGRCIRCGYDRSGLDPDAACPECGTQASARMATWPAAAT